MNKFLDEEYRMLVCGKLGKTNTVMYMLRKPLVFFDKIYLYTPNEHQDKIQDLKSVMDRMSEKVGNDVMEIKGQDDIVDTSDYEDIIIPPPLEFRDGYKPTPMPTTKKMMMPVPMPRTKIEEESNALKENIH